MTPASEPGEPFDRRVVAILVAIAALALVAFGLLVAFAGDPRGGHDARAHALSVSADGYAGLVELVDGVGSHPLMVRTPAGLRTRALLIVTPPPGGDPAALARLLAMRDGAPTLVVLPKWATRPLARNHAWVEAGGTLPEALVLAPLRRVLPRATLSAAARPDRTARRWPGDRIGPSPLQQRIAAPGLVPLLVDARGRIVLARIGTSPVSVLAEPDLFDDLGIADPAVARRALAAIDDLSSDNEIGFDLTLPGFAQGRSPLRLLVVPPFLPVTLCIALAGLLAALHGATRFGAPAPPERDIAFGKRALVDNAALLLRAARKDHRTGAAYAALTRTLVADAIGPPVRGDPDTLAALLDRAAPAAGDSPFATLAWRADVAQDRGELVAAAQALYRWRRNRMP